MEEKRRAVRNFILTDVNLNNTAVLHTSDIQILLAKN